MTDEQVSSSPSAPPPPPLIPILTGWSRYKVLKELGSGSFGVVYVCKDLLHNYNSNNTNFNSATAATTSNAHGGDDHAQQVAYPVGHSATDPLVAVKAVPLLPLSDAEAALAMNEAAILQCLDHPNVLKYIDCFVDEEQQLCTVTEFVDGGDLAGWIKKKRASWRRKVYLPPASSNDGAGGAAADDEATDNAKDGAAAAAADGASPPHKTPIKSRLRKAKRFSGQSGEEEGGVGGDTAANRDSKEDAEEEEAEAAAAAAANANDGHRVEDWGAAYDDNDNANQNFDFLSSQKSNRRPSHGGDDDYWEDPSPAAAGGFLANGSVYTDIASSYLGNTRSVIRDGKDPLATVGAAGGASVLFSNNNNNSNDNSPSPPRHPHHQRHPVNKVGTIDQYWDAFLVLDVARQLLEGLTYIHSQSILHRDIKPANIFITSDMTVKIGDFGVSKMLGGGGGGVVSLNLNTSSSASAPSSPSAAAASAAAEALTTRTFIGTPHYICPELCLGEPYSFPADVWALGVVLYELFTLELPFDASNVLALMHIVSEGTFDEELLCSRPLSDTQRAEMVASHGERYLEQSEGLGVLVATIVKSMLTVDFLSRPTAWQLYNMFFDEGSGSGGDQQQQQQLYPPPPSSSTFTFGDPAAAAATADSPTVPHSVAGTLTRSHATANGDGKGAAVASASSSSSPVMVSASTTAASLAVTTTTSAASPNEKVDTMMMGDVGGGGGPISTKGNALLGVSVVGNGGGGASPRPISRGGVGGGEYNASYTRTAEALLRGQEGQGRIGAASSPPPPPFGVDGGADAQLALVQQQQQLLLSGGWASGSGARALRASRNGGGVGGSMSGRVGGGGGIASANYNTNNSTDERKSAAVVDGDADADNDNIVVVGDIDRDDAGDDAVVAPAATMRSATPLTGTLRSQSLVKLNLRPSFDLLVEAAGKAAVAAETAANGTVNGKDAVAGGGGGVSNNTVNISSATVGGGHVVAPTYSSANATVNGDGSASPLKNTHTFNVLTLNPNIAAALEQTLARLGGDVSLCCDINNIDTTVTAEENTNGTSTNEKRRRDKIGAVAATLSGGGGGTLMSLRNTARTLRGGGTVGGTVGGAEGSVRASTFVGGVEPRRPSPPPPPAPPNSAPVVAVGGTATGAKRPFAVAPLAVAAILEPSSIERGERQQQQQQQQQRQQQANGAADADPPRSSRKEKKKDKKDKKRREGNDHHHDHEHHDKKKRNRRDGSEEAATVGPPPNVANATVSPSAVYTALQKEERRSKHRRNEEVLSTADAAAAAHTNAKGDEEGCFNSVTANPPHHTKRSDQGTGKKTAAGHLTPLSTRSSRNKRRGSVGGGDGSSQSPSANRTAAAAAVNNRLFSNLLSEEDVLAINRAVEDAPIVRNAEVFSHLLLRDCGDKVISVGAAPPPRVILPLPSQQELAANANTGGGGAVDHFTPSRRSSLVPPPPSATTCTNTAGDGLAMNTPRANNTGNYINSYAATASLGSTATSVAAAMLGGAGVGGNTVMSVFGAGGGNTVMSIGGTTASAAAAAAGSASASPRSRQEMQDELASRIAAAKEHHSLQRLQQQHQQQTQRRDQLVMASAPSSRRPSIAAASSNPSAPITPYASSSGGGGGGGDAASSSALALNATLLSSLVSPIGAAGVPSPAVVEVPPSSSSPSAPAPAPVVVVEGGTSSSPSLLASPSAERTNAELVDALRAAIPSPPAAAAAAASNAPVAGVSQQHLHLQQQQPLPRIIATPVRQQQLHSRSGAHAQPGGIINMGSGIGGITHSLGVALTAASAATHLRSANGIGGWGYNNNFVRVGGGRSGFFFNTVDYLGGGGAFTGGAPQQQQQQNGPHHQNQNDGSTCSDGDENEGEGTKEDVLSGCVGDNGGAQQQPPHPPTTPDSNLDDAAPIIDQHQPQRPRPFSSQAASDVVRRDSKRALLVEVQTDEAIRMASVKGPQTINMGVPSGDRPLAMGSGGGGGGRNIPLAPPPQFAATNGPSDQHRHQHPSSALPSSRSSAGSKNNVYNGGVGGGGRGFDGISTYHAATGGAHQEQQQQRAGTANGAISSSSSRISTAANNNSTSTFMGFRSSLPADSPLHDDDEMVRRVQLLRATARRHFVRRQVMANAYSIANQRRQQEEHFECQQQALVSAKQQQFVPSPPPQARTSGALSGPEGDRADANDADVNDDAPPPTAPFAATATGRRVLALKQAVAEEKARQAKAEEEYEATYGTVHTDEAFMASYKEAYLAASRRGAAGAAASKPITVTPATTATSSGLARPPLVPLSATAKRSSGTGVGGKDTPLTTSSAAAAAASPKHTKHSTHSANTNTNTALLYSQHIEDTGRILDEFRAYGRTFLASQMARGEQIPELEGLDDEDDEEEDEEDYNAEEDEECEVSSSSEDSSSSSSSDDDDDDEPPVFPISLVLTRYGAARGPIGSSISGSNRNQAKASSSSNTTIKVKVKHVRETTSIVGLSRKVCRAINKRRLNGLGALKNRIEGSDDDSDDSDDDDDDESDSTSSSSEEEDEEVEASEDDSDDETSEDDTSSDDDDEVSSSDDDESSDDDDSSSVSDDTDGDASDDAASAIAKQKKRAARVEQRAIARRAYREERERALKERRARRAATAARRAQKEAERRQRAEAKAEAKRIRDEERRERRLAAAEAEATKKKTATAKQKRPKPLAIARITDLSLNFRRGGKVAAATAATDTAVADGKKSAAESDPSAGPGNSSAVVVGISTRSDWRFVVSQHLEAIALKAKATVAAQMAKEDEKLRLKRMGKAANNTNRSSNRKGKRGEKKLTPYQQQRRDERDAARRGRLEHRLLRAAIAKLALRTPLVIECGLAQQ